MARIRSVKPEMRRSRTVCAWPIPVRYTLVGLIGYCDDFGRGLDDNRLIKADLYPIDDAMTATKVGQHLAVIEQSGMLCRYLVDDEKYLHLKTWAEHQRVAHPTPSRVPPCPIHEEGANFL